MQTARTVFYTSSTSKWRCNGTSVSFKVVCISISDPSSTKSSARFPNNVAWCLNISRQVLKRDEKLSKLHDFIVEQNSSGVINRQVIGRFVV